MKRTREERVKEYNRIFMMCGSVKKELLSIPGVVNVTVGLKVVNNLPTEELCFRVYVNRKKSVHEIPPHERIPLTIRDVKTDVNDVPKNVTACGPADYGKYRPLAGGTRIVSSKSFAEGGTLGCIAIDNDSEDAVLLSNYHILMINGEQPGHQVAQPEFHCDDSPCRCGEIAKLERGAWDEKNVDAAIARLTGKHQQQWINEVLELGAITSFPLDDHGKPKDPPVAGDTVFKRGMNSGLTEGLIIEVGGPGDDIDVGYPTKTGGSVTKTFTGQIKIGPKNSDKPFTRKGDSGAVIVNHLNQVIALHFADNEVRDDNGKVVSDATESYANPIWDVIEALDISIPDTGTLLSMPLNETTVSQDIDVLEELEKAIELQPEGSLLIASFKQHWKEVKGLINNDREVKVAWHRHKGPSFVAHILEKVKYSDYEVPQSIEGVSCQRLLTKMSVVLEKKGSPQLATDIEKYSSRVFSLMTGFIQSSVAIKM